MKIVIESTDMLTNIDGVAVRVWNGVTAEGVACLVFVHRLAVHNDLDSSRFDAELREELPPGRAVDLRHII
jgi:hypothetical protein